MDLEYFELDNQTYIDEELQPTHSDITYYTRLDNGKSLRVSTLFEHKGGQRNSYLPEHVQIITYKTGIWRQDYKSKRKPTFVYAMLITHHKKRWRERPFWKAFKHLPEEWRSFVDDIKFIVVDLAEYTDEEIEEKLGKTIICSVILAMKHSHDPDFFSEASRKSP